ncbi:hypothetical protein NDU88_006380 [Pleurodeles waltl]|uniref:Uncharacterized protein n=1 Tax=Pleurodeles waltl TaxID=8319 RepID=A0AAV7QJW4_PLEWA|nr:hypothetical protein NDU88_006380 [Pleurodeles waltl]
MEGILPHDPKKEAIVHKSHRVTRQTTCKRKKNKDISEIIVDIDFALKKSEKISELLKGRDMKDARRLTRRTHFSFVPSSRMGKKDFDTVESPCLTWWSGVFLVATHFTPAKIVIPVVLRAPDDRRHLGPHRATCTHRARQIGEGADDSSDGSENRVPEESLNLQQWHRRARPDRGADDSETNACLGPQTQNAAWRTASASDSEVVVKQTLTLGTRHGARTGWPGRPLVVVVDLATGRLHGPIGNRSVAQRGAPVPRDKRPHPQGQRRKRDGDPRGLRERASLINHQIDGSGHWRRQDLE